MILLLALAYPATIAVLFYFAFLRPVQQQQKKQREQLLSLRVGDEVLTQAGFIATIEGRLEDSRYVRDLTYSMFEERVRRPGAQPATRHPRLGR